MLLAIDRLSWSIEKTMPRPSGQDSDLEEYRLDLPMPLNAVVKVIRWAWQRVTKIWLYGTYVESHRKWNLRHRLGSRWQPLGEHLEYSLRLAQLTDDKPHVSRLALRSTGQTLTSVDLYFEARGAGVRYQDKISLCDVDRTPIICSLMNVPVLEFIGAPGERLAFSVEEVDLRQCVVMLTTGEELPPCDSIRSYLTQSWIMSDEWVYQWGEWWNCNAIKFAKGEIAIYWRFCFGLPTNRAYSSFSRGAHRRSMWQSFCSSIGWVLSLRPLIAAQFWLAIWSGLCVIGSDDRLRLRWRAGTTSEGRD